MPDAEESELSSVRDVESESQAENKPAKPTTDEADEKEPEEKPAEAPAKVTEKDADGSSSELSSLIDEPPPPKKKRQKADSKTKKSVKEKSKPTEPSKAPKTSKAKDTSDVPPQEAEIKRLQSWLIKCGIRKMWHRELAPCSTENAKISHLKQMLKDAGMDGRYSVEKARQIKEKRELAADLEAVQEGNKMWGQGSGDEEEGKDSEGGEVEEPAPKRRLAKGLQDLAAFDDEESD